MFILNVLHVSKEAHVSVFCASVARLSHPSSPDTVGPRWLQTGDGRDAGWAGGHWGSPTKKPSAAPEGQDCPMAAHHHVPHLLLQPAVGHVRGEDGNALFHVDVSIQTMKIIAAQNLINASLLPSSVSSLLTSSWRQVYRETWSAILPWVLEYLKSSLPFPAWVTPSLCSWALYLHSTHGTGHLFCTCIPDLEQKCCWGFFQFSH